MLECGPLYHHKKQGLPKQFSLRENGFIIFQGVHLASLAFSDWQMRLSPLFFADSGDNPAFPDVLQCLKGATCAKCYARTGQSLHRHLRGQLLSVARIWLPAWLVLAEAGDGDKTRRAPYITLRILVSLKHWEYMNVVWAGKAHKERWSGQITLHILPALTTLRHKRCALRLT